jgi:hypothetical protein
MTTIDKLREILCTVDVVREDLMELRFGCKFISHSQVEWLSEQIVDNYTSFKKIWWKLCSEWWNGDYFEVDKIIWNPIQERHFRLYCEEKWWAFAIGSTGKLIWNRNKAGSYCEMQLDNTLNLEQQSEETLLAIYNFLLEEKWQNK